MIQFDSIFLVDDDPINNLINKRLLGKVGIAENIYEFLEGSEALKNLELALTPHEVLIFLDINMPVMNGWEFLDAYMEKYPERKDKIVILSSSIDFQDRQKALEYEVVLGFLEKPLTMDKIHQQVTEFLEKGI
ncbi:response regulator [Algoriphagus zhangzhouensis]|uniref:Response regulator receiver domain-containing protein n=1 Tax=Algoriphagus zhangzhouensis TaxID=1073327 RepID=A0A1M7ZCT0_9BACT|nr:response regulator [Algoriphagus zhangzhouensis]TDY45650.1 response regulator receiver domain-containing protein [Algoriphagus zhangzhouensis]SHO62694.1 Response regulator receiver domain-containing protein [Algoriphagus zhangzhouensis]